MGEPARARRAARAPDADQRIRMAAMQAAAHLIAPALGVLAAGFQVERPDKIGGGAVKLAARFEHWIRHGADPGPAVVPAGPPGPTGPTSPDSSPDSSPDPEAGPDPGAGAGVAR